MNRSDQRPPLDEPEGFEPAVYPVFLQVLGSDLRVDCVHPETATTIARLWSWSVVEARPVDEACVLAVTEGDEPLADDALTALNVRICSVAGGQLAPSWLLLEAAAVAGSDGRVVVMAGGDRRTRLATLVEACLAGHAYVGSDLLAIGPDGAVLACPKPIREPSGAGGRATVHRPADLGLTRPSGPLVLARILIAKPDEGAPEPPVLETAPLMDALAALAPLVSAWRAPSDPLQRLARLVDRCGGAHLARYSGAHLADAVGKALRASVPGTSEWVAVTKRPANDIAWALRDGKVRQKPYVDAVEVEGEVLVLVLGAPLRLGPLGGTLWMRAVDGARQEDLVGAAIAEHGPHPEAARVVRTAVSELRDSHVLAQARPVMLAGFLAGALLADR